MPDKIACSIVIATRDAEENLPAILAVLGVEAGANTEVLICTENPARLQEVPLAPGMRIVAGSPGAAIPELWRDGILAARGRNLGLLSAHCVPRHGWLTHLQQLKFEGCAGYGGRISEPAASDAASRAMFCLRYVGASSPRAGRVHDIAADNACYDRDEILRCDDLLPAGFWEPFFHARFAARGRWLEHDPDLRADHINRYTPGEFMAQRRHHGRAFARDRVAGKPRWIKWGIAMLSPAVFPVFALKATRRILARPDLRRGFAGAAPWFYVFLANWSLGEITGYWHAAGARRS